MGSRPAMPRGPRPMWYGIPPDLRYIEDMEDGEKEDWEKGVGYAIMYDSSCNDTYVVSTNITSTYA